MPCRLMHQSDQENTAVSNRSLPTPRSWAIDTLNRALRTPRRFAPRDASRIPAPRLVADPTMLHIDPLTTTPDHNTFLKTVSPFLARIAAKH